MINIIIWYTNVGVLVLPGTANQNKLSVLIDLFNL